MGRNSDGNNKHGEAFQYDPDFNGPIKNRSCTDILCLLLFIIFIIIWIIVAGLAFVYGDPSKLILPTDKQGNVCGEGEYEDKPYLFFFDLTKCAKVNVLVSGCDTEQICVQNCPNETYFPLVDRPTLSLTLREAQEKHKPLYCKYQVNLDETVEKLVKSGECAQYVITSSAVGTDFRREVAQDLDYPVKNPFVGRCIPLTDSIKKAAERFQNQMNDMNITNSTVEAGSEYIQKMLNLRNLGDMLLEDLKNSWKLILCGLLLAMVLSFLWIVLMRWIAWIMLWLSIFLVIVVLVLACGYCFYRYRDLSQRAENVNKFKFTSWKSYDQKTTWLVLGIVIVVILFILILLLIFLRSRIRLAIALVEESSKAVGSMLSTLFFPVIPFLLQLVVIVFGLVVAAYISSAAIPIRYAKIPETCGTVCKRYTTYGECNDIEEFNKTCLSQCPEAECKFLKFETSHIVTGAQILNLFNLFWTVFLVVGLGQMVLAGAFASWYWTFDKSNVPTFVVANSFGRTLRYHMGSLAFGSLIIAIVKMIRVFLEYLDRKLKEYTDNVVAKCIMCCLKCCFWCLENFIKFINRNAYIMIAIYGKNFCTSAKNAFMLLMRNVARVVVLDKVTDFLLFLGKLTIVGCIGLLSFFFFSGKIKYADEFVGGLNYMAFPVTVICIGSYAIASCFFSVYSMAVDTLFLCFLEDCEMNDGSQEKPYRMSKNLMKILGKKNAKLMDPDEPSKN